MVIGSWLFRLKILTLTVVPAAVLVSLHYLLYTHVHGVSPDFSELGLWVIALALICFPIGQWTADGKLWALGLLNVVGTLWLGLSAFLAFSSRSFTLGFFSLFIALHWIVIRALLQSVVTKSFFDPSIRWFQSRPRAISGLKAELKLGETTYAAQVGRIDRSGVFLFLETPEPNVSKENRTQAYMPYIMTKGFMKQLRKLPLRVDFESPLGNARCKGTPIRLLPEEGGLGIRFGRNSPDDSKRLGDLMERLEGSGYV